MSSNNKKSSKNVKYISALKGVILYPFPEIKQDLSINDYSKEIYDHNANKNVTGFIKKRYTFKLIKKSGNWYLQAHFFKNGYDAPIFKNLNGQWTVNNARICHNCLYYGKNLRSKEYFENFYQEYGIPDKGYDYFCGCCDQHQVGFYG